MPFPVIRDGSVFDGDAIGGTSFDISVPVHEPGDILYTIFAQDGGSGAFTYTDWTLLLGPVDMGGSGTTSLYYREAEEGEPDSYELTSGTSERAAWASFAVVNDGGISGTPVAAGSVGGVTGITFPNYTTEDSGCLVLCIGVTDADTRPWTQTGFATRPQLLGIFGTASGATVGVYYFFAERATAYAIDDLEITGTQVVGVFQFAIKPADPNPSSAPAPIVSTFQRLRTYPHP